MAVLARQNVTGFAGTQLTYNTAAAGGDTLVGGPGVYIIVKNDHTAAWDVTLETPESVDGDLAVPNRTITVTNGTSKIIPVPARYNDATNGDANITYTGVTALTVAAVIV